MSWRSSLLLFHIVDVVLMELLCVVKLGIPLLEIADPSGKRRSRRIYDWMYRLFLAIRDIVCRI